MPFSDDVSLGPIEKLSAHLMLVDVFSGLQRFRFNGLGENIIGKLTNDLRGQFADEIKPAEPLNYFIAQASATIEAGTPTLARKENSPIKHGLSAAAWASITPLGSGS